VHRGGSDHRFASRRLWGQSKARSSPARGSSGRHHDPDKVDLSGVSGVTHAEQIKAESLLRSTILALPKWSDVAQAKADGFKWMGDIQFGGWEHYVHWDWINDGVILDPNRPESLVYRRAPGGRLILEAAMLILPKQYTLDNAPDIGGKLTPYHVHSNACFTNSSSPHVAAPGRFTDGTCRPPFVAGLRTPMVHVWIRPHLCGPFAPIAANAALAREQISCDSAHGS
jgi:hypothetical protein